MKLKSYFIYNKCWFILASVIIIPATILIILHFNIYFNYLFGRYSSILFNLFIIVISGISEFKTKSKSFFNLLVIIFFISVYVVIVKRLVLSIISPRWHGGIDIIYIFEREVPIMVFLLLIGGLIIYLIQNKLYMRKNLIFIKEFKWLVTVGIIAVIIFLIVTIWIHSLLRSISYFDHLLKYYLIFLLGGLIGIVLNNIQNIKVVLNAGFLIGLLQGIIFTISYNFIWWPISQPVFSYSLYLLEMIFAYFIFFTFLMMIPMNIIGGYIGFGIREIKKIF